MIDEKTLERIKVLMGFPPDISTTFPLGRLQGKTIRENAEEIAKLLQPATNTTANWEVTTVHVPLVEPPKRRGRRAKL